MEHKYYKFNFFGEDYYIRLVARNYSYNNRLAVQAYEEDGTPFAIFTVNIPEETPSGDIDKLAFIDTNNLPGVDKFLIDNEIAEPTGYCGCSGFCAYPEFKFNLNLLEDQK